MLLEHWSFWALPPLALCFSFLSSSREDTAEEDERVRFFDLLNLQHAALFLFPALVFVILFGMALAYAHFRTARNEENSKRTLYVFPDDIEDGRSPFPLALTLIIAGAVIWGFLYILVIGLLESKI
jgi:hypothetical protein